VRKLFAVALVFFVFVFSASAQSGAQGKITGKVLDSLSGSPLEYASITLQEQPDSKAVNGTVSDKAGHFVLADVKPGTYTVLVEFIGYSSATINNVSVTNSKSTVELKPFLLYPKQTALQTITVMATGKLVTNKIDKLVYNAERDVTSQSDAATDVLKKVPQVSVDVNGNVELAGSSSIRFLINGKPSTAFGNNVADVLQSIPASQIKSIEVVTNPGAKYDAQGLGGIINIVLKQTNAQGINGNVSLSAGTRADNGSFNFNARKGTFGANAFVSGNYRPAFETPATTDRTSWDTVSKTTGLLHQQGASQFNRHGFQTGMGFDWSPNKKNNINGSFVYNQFGNSGHGYLNQQQASYDQSRTSLSDVASQAYTSSSFRLHAFDAGLAYKRTFDKEDQELDIALNSSFGKSTTTADNYQVALPSLNRFYGNNNVNPGKENETEFRIDYVQPLKKDVNLGVGTKYTAMDIGSNTTAYSFQPSSESYLADKFLSNSLDYHQKVYAGYAELSFPAGKLFDAKIGGRYERTAIASFYSNAQQQAKTPDYFNVVPSVFLSRKIGENDLLKLSYAKRINRPDYFELNPFINTSDPKNLSSGNPFLQPEISHRLEFGYNHELGNAGSVSATLFYRMNEGDIQPFIRYYSEFRVGDSVYTNVAVTTRENIGQEKNTGLMLFSDLRPTSKLSIRSNLMMFHRHTINQQDPGYNSTNFNYRFNTNATYQFTPTLVAEFFGNFNSVRHEAQGKYPSFVSYSMAVRKQFWNKKGSLALTATNPFANYIQQKTELFGPGFAINSVRQIPIRSFGINFTWKFGGLEFKKEKEPENPALPPTEN
jgi:outer membrane receptor protein involved in Fe transport